MANYVLSHNGGVWLDVSHLPGQTIMSRLPREYQTVLDLQMVDITREPIEIAPTAHYSMGGVCASGGPQHRRPGSVRHR